MVPCCEHHFIMDALAPVRSINHLMAEFPGRWGFCGGWAIDLFLAHEAIDNLNGTELKGSILRINEARPRREHGGERGGGGGFGSDRRW